MQSRVGTAGRQTETVLNAMALHRPVSMGQPAGLPGTVHQEHCPPQPAKAFRLGIYNSSSLISHTLQSLALLVPINGDAALQSFRDRHKLHRPSISWSLHHLSRHTSCLQSVLAQTRPSHDRPTDRRQHHHDPVTTNCATALSRSAPIYQLGLTAAWSHQFHSLAYRP